MKRYLVFLLMSSLGAASLHAGDGNRKRISENLTWQRNALGRLERIIAPADLFALPAPAPEVVVVEPVVAAVAAPVQQAVVVDHQDINPADEQCWTPLHNAAQDGRIDDVRMLVGALQAVGLDINPADGDGDTPLHLAAYEGRLDIVQFLVEELAREQQDFNPETGDMYAMTPLHIAAQCGYFEIVQFLIGALQAVGLDINPTEGTARTPLHEAAMKGHIEICRILLEAGADGDAQSNDGITFLDEASDENRAEIERLIEQYRPLTYKLK